MLPARSLPGWKVEAALLSATMTSGLLSEGGAHWTMWVSVEMAFPLQSGCWPAWAYCVPGLPHHRFALESGVGVV
jgi:hypothetical protein